MRISRFAAAASVLSVVAVGCSAEPQPAAPSSAANGPSAAPKAASQIDPRWMGLGTSQLWNWELVDREITPTFQQFGVRPLASTEIPRVCNGCGEHPATAILTAFAPASSTRPMRGRVSR